MPLARRTSSRPMLATRSRGDRLKLACAATLTVSLLTACSGGGGSNASGDSATKPLTEDEATSALLTADTVADDLVEVPNDDEESDSSLGCLDAVEDLEATDAPVEVERSFEAETELEVPALGTQVSSYDGANDAVDALDAFRQAVEDCDSVDETDADGARVQLTIEVDDELTNRAADDQANLRAVGTISAEGFEFPFGLWFSAARVDNHIVIVGLTDLDESFGDRLDAYVEVAVDRLAAVAAGDTPDDTAVAAGSVGQDEEAVEGDDTGTEFVQQPLDGGTYTWESGITMTMSVERIEPWGDKDDFCGDGSCGIANPDDTRFVLKYEVTVPEDFPQPFDAVSCPGQLSVTSGNDDEALSGVAGDYDQQLTGKIFPGQTKFGVAEYYIEKAYTDQEFFIESTCGDVDYSGESAYFVGPISRS